VVELTENSKYFGYCAKSLPMSVPFGVSYAYLADTAGATKDEWFELDVVLLLVEVAEVLLGVLVDVLRLPWCQ
jgi:hypothetical protein